MYLCRRVQNLAFCEVLAWAEVYDVQSFVQELRSVANDEDLLLAVIARRIHSPVATRDIAVK